MAGLRDECVDILSSFFGIFVGIRIISLGVDIINEKIFMSQNIGLDFLAGEFLVLHFISVFFTSPLSKSP